ncbi:MAG TPA: hypothetical protein VFU63_06310 [Ktedonobacterales bacterium]|nr:hypothetical protein [Ktedonobacterales bacterium]
MTSWGTTTDSISALPYHDTIFSLFNAPTQEAKWRIIRTNTTILTAHATLDAFEQDVERSWNQGDRAMADYLWRIMRQFQCARDLGVDAAIGIYTQPIDQVRDIMVLVERSPTPYQTLKGIAELFAVLAADDKCGVYRVISEFTDQFKQPLSAAYVKVASRSQELSSDFGASTLERAAQLLDVIAQDQDVQSLISRWWPDEQYEARHADEPGSMMMEYLTTLNWYEAQQFVRQHYNTLLSNSELASLRSATREAWQTDRALGKHMWMRLRLLEHARIIGIDIAFNKLIWSPGAEQFWKSEREMNIMEAANIPYGNLKGLTMFIIALTSDSEQAISDWADKYWDQIQHPWVADHVRYLAEVAAVEGNESDRQAWEALADWLDEIRGEDPQAMLNQRQWAGIPGIDGLTLL